MKRRSRWLLRVLVVLTILGGSLYVLVWPSHPQWAASRGEASRPPDPLQETLLALKVQVALLEDLGLPALGLRIDTEGHRVFLRGEIDSAAAAQRACRVAAAVGGVEQVKNEMRVKATEASLLSATTLKEKTIMTTRTVKREVADALLEARVKTNLLSEVGANALGIDVEAQRGLVSLKGQVSSHEVKTLARAAAARTGGVKNVVDDLRIEARPSK